MKVTDELDRPAGTNVFDNSDKAIGGGETARDADEIGDKGEMDPWDQELAILRGCGTS